jgi:hypothetical protein
VAPLECEASEAYDKDTDVQYHLLIFAVSYEVLSSINKARRELLLQYFLQHPEEVRGWMLPRACRIMTASWMLVVYKHMWMSR